MRLKIGELAKRSGLTVRALHHYDAIGLLSPPQRSEGGARLYGPDDWIRLHRIEALKAFGHSLADIQACLDDPAVGMPLQILRRQIARLEAEAVRAQRLSRHLRQVVDLVTAGDETPATDWLDALELMNMYKKHLNENEVDALLAAGPDNVLHAETSWTTLTREVRDAVAGALPTDSSAAQALAWRWVRAVIGITRNDPVLASKLMQLQLGEPRAQQITGVTAAMLAWIDDAFVHARCALFAKYLDPSRSTRCDAANSLRRTVAPGRRWSPNCGACATRRLRRTRRRCRPLSSAGNNSFGKAASETTQSWSRACARPSCARRICNWASAWTRRC
jgi:DNA-binding transcriptional MerR regulator